MDTVPRATHDRHMTRELHEAVAELPLAERRIIALRTSVAAFVGFTPVGPTDRAVQVTSFEAFAAAFGDPDASKAGPYLSGAKLAHAVRGFFGNGGRECWIARAAGAPGEAGPQTHLAALELLADLDDPTIVATPDAHGLSGGAAAAATVQRELIRGCERVAGRIALVDTPPDLDCDDVLAWRASSRIDSPSAAAYHPWIRVLDPTAGTTTTTPPSGHVAGLWARVDERAGVHAAPTAEVVLATDGPASIMRAPDQRKLNCAGVNCLRAWPGPELRAWGACTTSAEPELRYLNRQRIVGHIAASIAQGTLWASEEVEATRLHERVRTVVSAFLAQAWRDGALQGDAPSQAYFVHCDEALDADCGRDPGDVVIEIGLAVRRGGEFRVLRITHRDA
jgi:hypothetical protein